MKKTLIYTIILDSDEVLYPPLTIDADCDYVAFTNTSGLKSEYWTLRTDENICKHCEEAINAPENFISGYEKYIYVAQNQVITGSIVQNISNLVTVPTIQSLLPDDIPLIEPTPQEFVPNPKYKGGPYNGYPLQLSICLPIGNKKDTLRKCLDGIKPLLDNLKSELIVVDTSTDGSRQIAESYGAKIIPFTWINDFSAARNAAIREAKGSWIFSIDDDEWFENVDEIIAFFKGKQEKTCDAAFYIVRNYNDPEGKIYNDFRAQRLAKNHPKLHYTNVIHESYDFSFLNHPICIKYFSAYAHHFGYAYKTTEERNTKLYRNIAGLYTAIKAEPLDLRLYFQLCNEITALRDYPNAVAFCFKLLSLCKLQLKVDSVSAIQWGQMDTIFLYTLAQITNDDKLFEQAYNLTNFKEFNCFQLGCITYFLLSHAVNKLDYEEVCKQAGNYYTLRNEYLVAPSKATLATSVSLDLVEPKMRCNTVMILHAFSLMKLGKQEEFETIVSKLDFSEIDDNDKNFMGAILYHLSEKAFIKFFPKADDLMVSALYNHAKSLPNATTAKKTGPVFQEIGSFSELAKKVEAANCFMDNSYVRLILVYGNPFDFENYDWFCEDRSKLETVLDDICIPAALHGYDLNKFMNILKLEGIQQMIRSLSEVTLEEFPKIFETYLPTSIIDNNFSSFSIEEIFLFTGFLESSLFKMPDSENGYLNYFTCYIKLLNRWTNLNYNTRMFEAQNFSLLPATSRGGIYMAKALENIKNKNACVDYIKSAVSECPLFDTGAKLFLKKLVESESKASDNKHSGNTEFELLGKQLKTTAKQLIDSGNFNDAENILLQLSKLLPEDDSVKELLACCKPSNIVN